MAQHLDALLGEHVAGQKWAIVAPAVFDEARVFRNRLGRNAQRVMVFFDLVSACTWLGVRTDAVIPLLAQLRSAARAPGVEATAVPVRCWYATAAHPDGVSTSPTFLEDLGTGVVYECDDGAPRQARLQVVGADAYALAGTEPCFAIRDGYVYATLAHPFGEETEPWFETRDVPSPSGFFERS
jgi:hypothetical protein